MTLIESPDWRLHSIASYFKVNEIVENKTLIPLTLFKIVSLCGYVLFALKDLLQLLSLVIRMVQ